MIVDRDEILRSLFIRGHPDRADARLRSFARRIGDARMCRRCDGDGLILVKMWAGIEPEKCPSCGGDGLEPPE